MKFFIFVSLPTPPIAQAEHSMQRSSRNSKTFHKSRVSYLKWYLDSLKMLRNVLMTKSQLVTCCFLQSLVKRCSFLLESNFRLFKLSFAATIFINIRLQQKEHTKKKTIKTAFKVHTLTRTKKTLPRK